MRRILSIMLCAVLMSASIPFAGATSEATHIQGGADPRYSDMTNEEIFEDALVDPSLTEEQRNHLLWKQETLEQQNSLSVTPRIDYMVYVDPIKQSQDNNCAAATVEMALNHLDIDCGTQDEIVDEIGIGPGINTVIDYMNEVQSSVRYMLVKWFSQGNLESICRTAVQGDIPIFLTLRCDSTDVQNGVWPYAAPEGHYTILRGYVPDGNTNIFSLADPYYYESWIHIDGANGLHYRTYSQILEVNTNQGRGYNYVAM